MERKDWNYLALLTIANFFAGILSTIKESITGEGFNFWMFFLVYAIIYGVIGLFFNGTGLFKFEHTFRIILIYLGFAVLSGIIAAVLAALFHLDNVPNLFMYIILAILGVGSSFLAKMRE